MRVVVTRPEAQAAAWVERLHALGVDAVALPLIGITALDDPAPLRATWSALADAALVVFVSANAVEHFLAARPAGTPWPAATTAGSTGPGTSAALRAAGVPPGCIAEPAADAAAYDSEALWARLRGRAWSGRRVLVVRGEEGRDWLAAALRAEGAVVDFIAAYRRLAPRLDDGSQAALADALAVPARHLWCFSSSEAIAHLRALAPGADWAEAAAVATHPRIAQAAREAGFGAVDSVHPSPEAVAAWVATRSIQSGTL